MAGVDVRSLSGLPGEEHVRWYLGLASREDALAEVADHIALDGRMSATEFVATIPNRNLTPAYSVTETSGWRSSPTGESIVSYRRADGNDYELIVKVDEA